MHRLFAAFILLIAATLPARGDTSVTITGGGIAIFSGPGLHRQHHDHGLHWGRSHEFGGGVMWKRWHRHDRLLLDRRHQFGILGRGKLHHWHHGHGHHWSKHARPQIVIILPGPFDSTVGIVTRPLPCKGGHRCLVPLPGRKPQVSIWEE